ncbi:hypothetical protein Trydic_g10003 [Trypoxylus dichotomus]
MQVRADIQLNPGRKPDWSNGQYANRAKIKTASRVFVFRNRDDMSLPQISREDTHLETIIENEMPSAPTEFEDMVEIVEAISASLVSRKKKVPTPSFTL